MIQSATIEALKANVEAIIADNARLREEILKLISERDGLINSKRELTSRLDEQNRRIAVLEMAEAVGGAAGNTDAAKARINRLLKEINKCIELVNK